MRRGRALHVVHLPTALAYVFTSLMGRCLGDVVLTWAEYRGLMSDLLTVEGPPTGRTRLSQWLEENRENVGRRYVSEVARHYAKPSAASA